MVASFFIFHLYHRHQPMNHFSDPGDYFFIFFVNEKFSQCVCSRNKFQFEVKLGTRKEKFVVVASYLSLIWPQSLIYLALWVRQSAPIQFTVQWMFVCFCVSCFAATQTPTDSKGVRQSDKRTDTLLFYSFTTLRSLFHTSKKTWKKENRRKRQPNNLFKQKKKKIIYPKWHRPGGSKIAKTANKKSKKSK